MIYVSAGRGGWILGSLVLSFSIFWMLDTWVFYEGLGALCVVLAFAISGLFCLGLGLHARLQPARLVLEVETGRERLERLAHSLYWIRAEYWGVIYLTVAIWLASLPPIA